MYKPIAQQHSGIHMGKSIIQHQANVMYSTHQSLQFILHNQTSTWERGFTLIEILVAILVLSIGLLGLAGLQATGLQSNHSGYLRSQATIFAYEMADRLRANRSTAISGSYNIALTDSAPSGTAIQDADRSDWINRLGAALPAGDGAVSCSTTTDANGETTCVCTLTVQWNDTRKSGESQQFIMTTQI